MGFSHNNCGGFCIKAGQGHFKLLLEKMPERYAYHERKEQELRDYLGKDVSIMSKVTNYEKRRYTLRDLRLDVEGCKPIDELEIGGCGCMLDD
jgi:hypothetical protein